VSGKHRERKATTFQETDTQIPKTTSLEESQRDGLSDVLELARTAYTEKRQRDSWALVKAVLKIDPPNHEARVLQSLIQSDLNRDLQRVRALVQEARTKRNERLFHDAQLILRGLLAIDPQHQAALDLLKEMDSVSGEEPQSQPAASDPLFPKNEPAPLSNFPWEAPKRKTRAAVIVVLLAALLLGAFGMVRYFGLPDFSSKASAPSEDDASPAPIESVGTLAIKINDGVQVFINEQLAGVSPIPELKINPGKYHLRYELNGATVGQEDVTVAEGTTTTNSVHALLGRLELFVAPTSGVTMQIDENPPTPLPEYVDVQPGEHRILFTAMGYEPKSTIVTAPAGGRANVSVVLAPSIPAAPAPINPPPSRGQAGSQAKAPVAVGAKGTLAVSSLVPAEMYRDNSHIGTTPLTVELPVGTYTFEYRYGDLRSTVTSTIRNNDVTRTTVTFETTIDIDSRPQAQVYLEGIQRLQLGQTPLKGIRMVVGSVLVFTAPGFPDKRWTVREKDQAIRMVFP
jgi:hypothetical protein